MADRTANSTGSVGYAGSASFGAAVDKHNPLQANIGYRVNAPSSYGCAGGSGAMSGGGENAQFGATAAMVAAATTAAMQDSQPFSQMQNMTMGNPQYNAINGYGQQRSHNPGMTGMAMGGNGGMNGMTGMGQMGNAGMNGMNPMAQMANMGMHANMMSSQMGPGQMAGSAKMGPQYQRRHTPYPQGPMLMNQRKQQYMGGQPTFGPGQYPAGYGGRPGFQGQYPPQQPLGPSGNFAAGMRGGMRQTTPPYSNQGQYFNGGVPNQFPQHQGGNSQYGQYSGQFAQEVAMRTNMSYQHSPVPGNPTPPLTPASSMPPYISPNSAGEGKPHFNELKQPMGMQNDELRLTFPVRDGIILPPFRLEHNLAVSNHVFQLKATVHSTLIWRSDLELQLKCFHHEDRQMNTNWPASVQVSVNATPLVIDRGENKTSHKPLYLKEVCQPGRNTIQITVSACCCSHLFVLQLVHRPSVRSVLQGLLRKRLLTADHCIAKIKMNFNQSPANSNNVSNNPNDRDSVEQTALKVSLKCPITFKKITLPARGHECKHIQCFDLESYLQLNCERGSWRCPVCNKPAQLEGLEVDQYMWGILNTANNSDVDEVTIDAGANWKPAKNPANAGIKDEDSNDNSVGKRGKAVSPGSMNMPTMNNWDQALSPYLPPDMNTIASGSMISSYNQSTQNRNANGNPNYDFGMSNGPGSNEFAGNGPLSHLNDSVNSLDPLNAMEKSLNDQMPHTPHTPHTPGSAHTPGGGGGAHTPGSSHTPGPPSVGHHSLTDVDIPSDLNFDPAAVIDGEGTENLNLLPETSVDPMELLSYLDAPALGELLATPPSSSSSAGSHPPRVPSSDDLLALFE